MFSVVVEGWDEFVRDLARLGQTGARKEMTTELMPVAEHIASDAKSRAGAHVARAIRVKRSVLSPQVVVDGSLAPDNKLWEFSGRHPVFGNDWWVFQPARPYLGPAVEAHAEEAAQAIGKALDKALSSAGWS